MPAPYKNAPVVDTTFEARFPGDLSIEAKRDKFQKSLKGEFPNLYVPNAMLGTAPALQPCQFRKEDDSAWVSLAVNSLAYSTSKYSGFEPFKMNLEKTWKAFADLFRISSFTRLGLRYINHLPIIREEIDTILLSRYLATELHITPRLPSQEVHDFAIALSCAMTGGRLRLSMKNQKRHDGLEILVMDLDFYRVGAIDKKERLAFIESAHEQIEAVFLSLISDEYKAIMRGEQNE